jgi:hypothetical protein
LPTGPENDHFCPGGEHAMILGARVLRAAHEQAAGNHQRDHGRHHRCALPPVLASTSSAIEFGTGRGFSIRESSGSRIRK